jgi:hypothetical protein
MESETNQPVPAEAHAADVVPISDSNPMFDTATALQVPVGSSHGIGRFFIGPDGLRAGWSVLIWIVLMTLFLAGFGFLSASLHLIDRKAGITTANMFFNELASVLALLVSVAIMALIERRRLLDYNLRGPHRARHFFAGIGAGFAALSVLVASLAAGGWLHFGGVDLTGAAVLKYAVIWGATFLLVGCFEEGTMRCYLLATLTRGINFWWAFGINALVCLLLIWRIKGNGVWGDYALALLGLMPCFLVHQRKATSSGFWQATWVTSTLFGFVHTGNGGENWIGIFAAGAIGFVFCVSVRVTGSAWWAIGAHAGWDWGETYFYGTPDSGLVASGHLLKTSLGGNALWSGGTDGPEGSLLVIGVILLLLLWVVMIYGRSQESSMPQTEPTAVEGDDASKTHRAVFCS